MKELSYSHSPFRREQCVCVLTDRRKYPLCTESTAGGAGTESKARICFFPLLTHSHHPEMTRQGAWVQHGLTRPEKPSVAQAKLVTPFPTSHWAQTSQGGSWADGTLVSEVWRAWARAQHGPGKGASCQPQLWVN